VRGLNELEINKQGYIVKPRLILFSLLAAFLVTACTQDSGYIVEKIEDGDTLIVKINGETQRIQLSGIDAPENADNAKLKLDADRKGVSKEALLEIGMLSASYLKMQVTAGQTVSLQGNLGKRDKYGRIPAIVSTGQCHSLNKRMVEEGYAILLDRYPMNEALKEELKVAQEDAKANHKGLWRTHGDVMAKWSGL
jgi:micrococcal nuclease